MTKEEEVAAAVAELIAAMRGLMEKYPPPVVFGATMAWAVPAYTSTAYGVPRLLRFSTYLHLVTESFANGGGSEGFEELPADVVAYAALQKTLRTICRQWVQMLGARIPLLTTALVEAAAFTFLASCGSTACSEAQAARFGKGAMEMLLDIGRKDSPAGGN